LVSAALSLHDALPISTSKMAPSPYSRCEGVSFTGLPHKDELARRLAAIRRTSLPSSAPSPERATVPEPAESSAPPSLTMTSATRSEGRSASTRPMACALLWVGMTTDTARRFPHHHHGDEARRRPATRRCPRP